MDWKSLAANPKSERRKEKNGTVDDADFADGTDMLRGYRKIEDILEPNRSGIRNPCESVKSVSLFSAAKGLRNPANE
jgi:hypothetical protein